MLIAESHSGGFEPEGVGFQQTIQAPCPSAALSNPTAPRAKGECRQGVRLAAGDEGSEMGGLQRLRRGVTLTEECRNYVIWRIS